jgi:hypothetical protein
MSAHPNREELFDLYALGVLEGDELADFGAHIATCDDCAHKLAEAQGRIALLSFAAPPAQPSPGVKESLLRQLSASADGRTLDVEEPHLPHSRFRAGWWNAIFAPAAAALALATILLWLSNNRLNNEIQSQQAGLQQLKQQTEQTNTILDLVSARDTISVPLAPSPEAKGATAHVLYNARLGKMFYSDTLSAAPPDKSYQLWLVPCLRKSYQRGHPNARTRRRLANGSNNAARHRSQGFRSHNRARRWQPAADGFKSSRRPRILNSVSVRSSVLNRFIRKFFNPIPAEPRTFSWQFVRPVGQYSPGAVAVASVEVVEEGLMRKIVNVLAVLALVCAMVTIVKADDKTMTWTGWISDSHCAAKGMAADHKACAEKCVKEKGASYVFVDTKTKAVHNIHNQDAVNDSDLGMEVKVTGHLMDDGALHVDSIAAAGGQM